MSGDRNSLVRVVNSNYENVDVNVDVIENVDDGEGA